MKRQVLIVAPSLDLATNVSGVSAVTNFIIDHNKECEYTHFLQGKSDGESGALKRIVRIWRNYRRWNVNLNDNENENKNKNDNVRSATIGDASLAKNLNKNKNDNKNDNVNDNDRSVHIDASLAKNAKVHVDVDVDVNRIIHYNFPLDAFSIVRDYFFMRVAYRRRKRMVIHVHGGLYLFKEQKPWVIRHLLNEVFSWDCPFIVLSNREKEQIQRLYGTKNVTVLPNCVEGPEDVNVNDNKNKNENEKASPDPSKGGGMAYEMPAGTPLPSDRPAGTPLPSRGGVGGGVCNPPTTNIKLNPLLAKNENGIDMLYLGRIEKNKGMDYLLEAMRELKAKGAQLTLHFAGIEQGKNGYIGRFQELLGDRFVYEGVVAGDQKTALFRRCQVFVLPSLYEGLPMSLLETMSYGLVPVVTDVGSITEYVDDGVNGLLIKTKDAASIITAVDRLLHDRATLQKMSAAARQTIATRLQPTKYIEQLNRIYSSIP